MVKTLMENNSPLRKSKDPITQFGYFTPVWESMLYSLRVHRSEFTVAAVID